MEAQLTPNSAEAEAILTVCLLAAFAEGANSELERGPIKRITENLPNLGADHAALIRQRSQSIDAKHLLGLMRGQ